MEVQHQEQKEETEPLQVLEVQDQIKQLIQVLEVQGDNIQALQVEVAVQV